MDKAFVLLELKKHLLKSLSIVVFSRIDYTTPEATKKLVMPWLLAISPDSLLLLSTQASLYDLKLTGTLLRQNTLPVIKRHDLTL
jgi:hypothetical protein